ILFYFFFFFQAEDGIRDRNVTGVQTCALPISRRRPGRPPHPRPWRPAPLPPGARPPPPRPWSGRAARRPPREPRRPSRRGTQGRSEERRVGKEGRSRGAREHYKKNIGDDRG